MVVDNFSCLANSLLVYVIKNPTATDPIAIYNGWATTDRRSYGYETTEKAQNALRIIESLLQCTAEELEIMRQIEEDDGNLYDYCETSN
jgi:hypothetical protein